MYAVILVHSKPTHFYQRKAIRETSLQNELMKKVQMQRIFVLGNPNRCQLQKNILTESNKYQDVIQADFLDSYHNLTLKHLVGIKWVLTFCNIAKYIIKMDDDFIVDMFKVTEVMQTKLSHKTRIIAGYYIRKGKMGRLKRTKIKHQKWHLPIEEHEGQKDHPPYMSGWLYVISADLLAEIYKEAFQTVFLWIEDLFITGYVAEHLWNVRHVALNKHYNCWNNETEFMAQYKQADIDQHCFLAVTDSYYPSWQLVSQRHEMATIATKN